MFNFSKFGTYHLSFIYARKRQFKYYAEFVAQSAISPFRQQKQEPTPSTGH